ncbi:MAG: amino acid adenylation domain-containing protein, partial [Pseudomonadota bacterium]|nr:amino acid adenylation domain-containing protein [Pseudomonadota bacterium]
MQELLLKVARAGIRVELDGDELKVMGPAHALTPDLREALQTHKSVLIEGFRQMQSKKYDAALPEFVAAPQARAEPFPLTDVQHAYWMGRHKLVELGQVATHFYFELDCVDFEHDRLNTALCRLIERHEMLRAVVDSNGLQRILPDVPQYHIAVQDLSKATSAEAEGAIVATREAMSLDVLPADQWPLFDIRATCLADGHSRLHVSLDMLTMDAWSMFVLFQEWHQLYENLHQPLPAIDISYRDYILTERRLLGGAAHERARRYWEERLDTLPGAPELPILGTTKTEEPPRFSRRRIRIDKARWLTLKTRARNEGLTPSGLLLAVYAEVLTRWSSSAHYTLNLTLFNRLPVHPQVSRLIGDFTSLTMLEVDHRNHNSSFRQRAAALQRRLMDDLEHSEYSGVQVLREWSQRQRAGMHAAMPVVFTSALVLGGEEGGQDASLVERFGPMVYGLSQTPQVWLDNQVMEIAGDLVFNWDAVDAMFEPGVLDAMFDAHHALLLELADDESSWDRGLLVDLPQSMLATRSEQVEPLVERVLHAGLFEFAQRTPDAPALISGERTLTYRMLLAESTNVARWLQTQGLRPGELVGVVMHKGWQQMVGVFGILQAGGAYMPVDASLPPQRQHELLQLGQVRCVLTQTGGLPLAPEFAVQEIVALAVSDDDLPPLTSAQVQPADLAYVIFTSGTTGQPKGVMISHQAAYNTILHINEMLDLRAEDRILAVSSLSFDLSVYDLFGAIDVGAALVLPAAERHLDALHWRDLIEQHQVSIWNSAPQLMRMLADSVIDVGTGNTHLRAVLLSGDWIPVDLPSRLRALYPDAVVISLGGATEASIWSISYQIDAVDPDWSSIPYGKALPNQSMLVLNGRFESSPDFVRGGIYIGGAGLAEGYWRDAERTAQRFITHPESGARLYDTGDMGRYLPDGNIEFLGRNDDQVKIRGHRVEPGEVAAVLRQHPEVQEAVVLATGIKQNRQLAAYVQLTDTPIQELGYRHAVAVPAPLTSLLSARVAATAVRELDADLQSTWARLDDYYLSAVMTALRSFGITGTPGELLTVQDLLARGVAPRYRRWLGRAFDELGSAGLVSEVAAEVFEICAPWQSIDLPAFSGEIEQRLQQALSFSEQEARWFTQAVEQLRDILTEHLHSAEIYTADATARIYQKLFPDNHQQLSLVIDALLEQRGGSLSVLEIGAGLGSATQHVLPGLMATGCHYTFTDISEFFLNRAQQLFGDQSGSIEFACYNVDIRPEFQGFQRNGFDLVLASSMLHDVCDIHSALNNIRGLLKPGGQLVLLEETRFF